MNFSNILDKYEPYLQVRERLENNITPIGISGVSESAYGHLVFQLSTALKKSALVICYSDLEAMSLFRDISFFTDRGVFFPSKEYIFYDIDAVGRENEQARLNSLYEILNDRTIVVASIEAIVKYTCDFEEFKKYNIVLNVGEEIAMEELCEKLVRMGYTKDVQVEGVGQFSVRGGIMDIFSPNSDYPVRVEFFGDEVDSIRTFDPETQRSLENKDMASIIPCSECILSDENRQKLLKVIDSEIKKAEKKGEDGQVLLETLNSDREKISEGVNFPAIDKYIPKIQKELPTILDYCKDMTVFVVDPKRIAERGKNMEWELAENVSEMAEHGIISGENDKYYLNYADVTSKISGNNIVALNTFANGKSDFDYKFTCDFVTKTAVSFHGKIEYLADDLKTWTDKKFTVLIFAQTESNAKNLYGVLSERGFRCEYAKDGEFAEGSVTIINGSLNKGFEYPKAGIAVVSDREIFDIKSKRRSRKDENTKRIKSYNDIHVGDYVVHRAHGIGIYEGIKKLTANSVTKDYLQIRYKGGDMLYVPAEQLDVLYKYSGNTEKELTLNKLGGTDWSKTKQRVKKSTEEMAKKLVELYAARENSVGYAFSPDTVWQREFEDTFAYTETEDQLRSIEEVKEDMEKAKPMDRLLCGDVGFGKTEVALRAAFKAVMDGKQVAYLCPTTILAMQHFNTFLSRMSKFPINIQMLSRFRTQAQQKKILKQLKDGEIDIIVGTHKLLGKGVEFKDLGLLIVDEEQRFGVGHKEKLKEIKKNIDVLTMTATPIPRTLHMSMISVRDMSVLTQPPENRYPVKTYVLEDNFEIVANAIKNELARGGQVFYLHNRVQGIYSLAEKIKKAVPEARVSVGHGKMKEEELEEIMYGMINGDTDVLVCTTIIETGLDIPNANTIIIDNADKMGLAQLYQLRGRVGRSNRMAYAYLTYQRDKMLSDTAEKRLRAIKEFTEFGSGFKIAMRDLEIRGAGNLLGAEQSGHMEAVGYDMYCRILKESVRAISGEAPEEDFQTSVDIALDAFIPESYIRDSGQRIEIYKKIAQIEDDEDRSEIIDELTDRYGDIPKRAMNVIDVAVLKAMAHSIGIFELTQRGSNLQMKFERDKINLQKVVELDKKFPSRVKLIPTQKPVLNFKLSSDKNNLNEIKDIIKMLKGEEEKA